MLRVKYQQESERKTERNNYRLTGDCHPWISWYVRDAGLSGGRLLAWCQRINDSRCSGGLMIELCSCSHGGGRSGNCRRGWRGRDQATRCSAVLMMMTKGIIYHRIGGRWCDISGKTGGVTARFVTGGGSVDGRGRGQRGARSRGRTEAWHHAGRGTEGRCRYRLLLLMMMVRRCRRYIWIHASGGTCSRWRRGWTSWVLWTGARRARRIVLLRVIHCRGRDCSRG